MGKGKRKSPASIADTDNVEEIRQKKCPKLSQDADTEAGGSRKPLTGKGKRKSPTPIVAADTEDGHENRTKKVPKLSQNVATDTSKAAFEMAVARSKARAVAKKAQPKTPVAGIPRLMVEIIPVHASRNTADDEWGTVRVSCHKIISLFYPVSAAVVTVSSMYYFSPTCDCYTGGDRREEQFHVVESRV